MQRRVAIFKNHILPASEAWLYHQLRSIDRYEVGAFGRRRANADQFPLPGLEVVRENGDLTSRAEEILFVLARRSPTLLRALQRFQPHLMHAHFGVDGAYAMAFAERLGLPLAVSFYGYDASRLPAFRLLPVSNFQYYLRFQELGQYASLLIAYTDFLAGRLIAKGMPKHKIRVHYLGIPVERFAVETANMRRPKHVLFVGRFVEKKGLPHLLEGFQRAAKRVAGSDLFLVGDGPLRVDLQRLTGRLGIADRVHFVGRVRHAGLPEWHRKTCVFTHPSITTSAGETEGLPFSILEAQAAGLPVVATRHAGIPEGVMNGETGILVEEGDVEAIAEALIDLLEDDERRDHMAKQAVEFMRAKFDVHECTRELENLYDTIAS